jgi:hypothetical protein
METRRHKQSKRTKNVWKYCTKLELFDKYKDWDVVDKIIAGKRSKGLFCANPDLQDDRDLDLFFVRDLTEMSEENGSEQIT